VLGAGLSSWWWPAAAGVGYLVGSVSPAAIVARLRGVDLRGSGSGNPGATNAGRVMGARVGVLVGLLDVLKGFVPAYAFGLVDHELGLVAGAAAVVGHVTSPFLKGRGGRGVATSLGAVLAVEPVWALVALATFGVTVALTRWVALGSMLAAVALVVCAVVSGAPWPDLLFVIALATVVELRHVPNVVRRWREGPHPRF
jgi:glycerol-3-phosphate acyltransferase PlsY